MAQRVKNPPANARDTGDVGSIPGSGRYPGEGNGSPGNSCLGNPMDRGDWWALPWGHKSWTWLSDWAYMNTHHPESDRSHLNDSHYSAAAAKSCQLCPTPCGPIDGTQQAPPSLGFSRQEYWSGLQFHSPGDLPDPGIKPASPALTGGFFTTESSEKSLYSRWSSIIKRSIKIWN